MIQLICFDRNVLFFSVNSTRGQYTNTIMFKLTFYFDLVHNRKQLTTIIKQVNVFVALRSTEVLECDSIIYGGLRACSALIINMVFS